METVRTTFVAWGKLVSCLQTDVQDHFVLARELLSAKPSFEVVRIRSCACACAQGTWNCPLHTGDGSREKLSQAPVGKLFNDQKFFCRLLTINYNQ